MSPHVVRVGEGRATAYDVVIGHGVSRASHDTASDTGPRGGVFGVLPQGVAQVLLVTTASVRGYADGIADDLASNGLTVTVHEVPEGEAAKTVEVAAQLWSLLGRHAFTRTDAIVSVGGGAVTDLGGFVAATWLRGVAAVSVPTTLLAMVDAAVGGKTGINTAEGKNLVGCFAEPAGVFCDLDTLATLPRADLAAGVAEVVKGGFIADPVILELIEADPQGVLQADSPVLAEVVARKIAVKAEVVTADLTESSVREILNYGHTFGHAIEQVEGYTWRHGDAVAVGMCFAAELGHAAGSVSSELLDRHRRILSALGLPTAYRGSAGWDRLRAAMARDKKSRGSTLRFVVLDDVGRPTRLVGPDEEWLRAAFAAVTTGDGAPVGVSDAGAPGAGGAEQPAQA